MTYLSVALAYAPLAIKGSRDADRTAKTGTMSTTSDAPSSRTVAGNDAVPRTEPTEVRRFIGLGMLLLFLVALPMLVIFGSLPSGLISAVIIFVGLRQAWKMTGAPFVQILGPYRVGAAPASTSA